MDIGYARVCRGDPAAVRQIETLQVAGCGATFVDVVECAECQYVGLAAALAFARGGDRLVICRLDRLGRSLPHLVELIEGLRLRRVGVKSLSEGMDTTSGEAASVTELFATLANVERHLRRERTLLALEAARADGRRGGRPRSLTEQQIAMAQSLYDDLALSIDDICRTLRISKKTLYRYVRAGTRRLWRDHYAGQNGSIALAR
jgi:DNA invertase Pin-like site-specific DNA recombinase